MEVLPAIDLRHGEVVRLRRGDDAARTGYSSDPASVLRGFATAGARGAHVVDLDAAFGEPPQRRLLEHLAAVSPVKLQLGGGVRDRAALDWAFAAGFARVVVGSWLIRDPEAFLEEAADASQRIVAALEFRQGELRVAGWLERSAKPAVAVLAALRGAPLAAALVTDIERDGELAGPNLALCARVGEATRLPVLVSGGVKTLADVRRIREQGFAGMVVGRALYESTLSLGDALRVAAGEEVA